MKLRTALVGLTAALGGCPLLRAVDLHRSEPLCTAADLIATPEADSADAPVVVITTCSAGTVRTRDRAQQIYTRTWRETLQCDLHLTDAARAVATLRACPQSR